MSGGIFHAPRGLPLAWKPDFTHVPHRKPAIDGHVAISNVPQHEYFAPSIGGPRLQRKEKRPGFNLSQFCARRLAARSQAKWPVSLNPVVEVADDVQLPGIGANVRGGPGKNGNYDRHRCSDTSHKILHVSRPKPPSVCPGRSMPFLSSRSIDRVLPSTPDALTQLTAITSISFSSHLMRRTMEFALRPHFNRRGIRLLVHTPDADDIVEISL